MGSVTLFSDQAALAQWQGEFPYMQQNTTSLSMAAGRCVCATARARWIYSSFVCECVHVNVYVLCLFLCATVVVDNVGRG
jgi:hypothetical protein